VEEGARPAVEASGVAEVVVVVEEEEVEAEAVVVVVVVAAAAAAERRPHGTVEPGRRRLRRHEPSRLRRTR
jgi:hypothetical protein